MLSQDLAIPILGGGAAQEASSATAWSEEAGSGGGVGASKDAEAWPTASWRGQPSGGETELEVQKTVNKFVLFFHEVY